MPHPTSAINHAGSTGQVKAPSSVDPTTAGQVASVNKSTSAKSTFGTMNELKERSPKLYKSMMQGIAMNIVDEMRRAEENFKRAVKGQPRQ